MKKSKSIGIRFLIFLQIFNILGFIYSVFSAITIGFHLSAYQMLLDSTFLVATILSLYFLIRPSPFGWKFILGFSLWTMISLVGQTIYFKILRMEDGEYTGPPFQHFELVISLAVSALSFWIVYKAKNYFYDIPEPGREDLLDDEVMLE